MKPSTPEDLGLRWLPQWAPVVIAAASVPLLGHSYAGTVMRYVGDDYCYAMVLRQHGFWGAQVASYLGPSPYHGNRFSLTLFADLSGLIGPRANAFLPAIAVLLLIFTAAYLAAGLFGLAGRRLGPGAALAAGAWLTFATLDQSPDVVQSIYWRPGMLPYTAPLIGALGLAGFILDRSGRARIRPGTLAATALAGLIAGGFSETGAALLITVLLLLVLAGTWGVWRGNAPRSLVRLSGAGLLGAAVALAILAISPTNADRLAGEAPALLPSARMAAYHAYLFLHGSVKHLWLPTLVTALPFFAAGLLHAGDAVPHTRKTAISLALLPVFCFVLLVAAMAPSAYALSSYPAPRALIGARLMLLLTAAGFGWFGSQLVILLVPRQGLLRRWSPGLAGALLVAALLYPLSAAPSIYAQAGAFREWTARWDARHTAIVQAVQRGEREVEVQRLRTIVPGVGELSTDPDHWYNNCAEGAYGLRQIRAVDP